MSRRSSASFINQVLSPVGIITLLVIIIILSGGAYLYAHRDIYVKQIATIVKPKPTPKPTPIPLPPGKGVYNISQGQHQGPTISQVSFDPLDVRSGQKLTITIKAADKAPVTNVTAILQLDNTQKNLTFKLIGGSALSGDWQTSIKIDDTLWYRYILTITSVSTNGTNKAIVAPRS